MTTEEMQTLFEQFVKSYFAGARVLWGETNQVKPFLPFVSLKLTNVSRLIHPDTVGEEEVCRRYLCSAQITVNLYTQGRKPPTSPGMTAPPSRNTAVSDMQHFLCFLDSDEGQDFLAEHNLCILAQGNTLDVSALLNESKYEYRALQEFTVEFVDEVIGHAGITLPKGEVFKPTPSGGGTKEQAESETGWFHEVELIYKK